MVEQSKVRLGGVEQRGVCLGGVKQSGVLLGVVFHLRDADFPLLKRSITISFRSLHLLGLRQGHQLQKAAYQPADLSSTKVFVNCS